MPANIPRHPEETAERSSRRTHDGTAVRNIAAQQGSLYLPLQETMCPRGTCVTLTPDGTPIFFDDDHLTPAGSVWLMQRMWPRIADAVAHPGIGR